MNQTHEPSIKACGVLMYSPQRDAYLLAREARNGQWSDFGGKRDADESPLQCAQREFEEESMGLIAYTLPSTTQYIDYRGYRLYLVEKDDIGIRPEEFEEHYRRLKAQNVPKEWLEKDALGWFSLEEVFQLPLRVHFANQWKQCIGEIDRYFTRSL